MSLAHRYLTPTNLKQTKLHFFEMHESLSNPHFIYTDVPSRVLNSMSIDDRDLIIASKSLIRNNSIQNKKRFIEINQKLFGQIDSDYVHYILRRLQTQSLAIEKKIKLWRQIKDRLNLHESLSTHELLHIGPSIYSFNLYRSYFQKYIDPAVPKSIEGLQLKDALSALLCEMQLNKLGWKVVVIKNDASRARTNYDKKTIIIGEEYKPRRSKSVLRIAIHEVLGHALRGKVGTLAEREGFAILLEQLLSEKFYFRRSYRYLAAAVAAGVAGDAPKCFVQTYEIMWRVMSIGANYAEDKAKSYAFDECARVFRGTNCDDSGAVFLKDTIYFNANITLWKKLEKAQFSYNEFVDIIEGRREIL